MSLSLLLLPLAAATEGHANSGAARLAPRCGLEDAVRIARNSEALVVFRSDSTYEGLVGCAGDASVHRMRLHAGRCPRDPYSNCGTREIGAQLNGPIVGYVAKRIQRGGGTNAYALRAVDLRDGTLVRVVGTLMRPSTETDVGGALIAHVVSSRGSFAWSVATAEGYEIRRADDAGTATLAAGIDVDPRSLRLDGHRLSWTERGVEGRARLR